MSEHDNEESIVPIVPKPRRLVSFPAPDHGARCGYCGFDPAIDTAHLCDGFGHSLDATTGDVLGSGCRDCALGFYCEKAVWLTCAKSE